MKPIEAVPDEHGAIKALIFESQNYNEETGKFENTGEFDTFPARTVCVAAGTSPNVIYEKEKPGTFKLDEWRQFFQPFKLVKNGDGKFHVDEVEKAKTDFSRLMNTTENLSVITATIIRHYAGNVVKAMASAKFGYPKVVELFDEELRHAANCRKSEKDQIFDNLKRLWTNNFALMSSKSNV